MRIVRPQKIPAAIAGRIRLKAAPLLHLRGQQILDNSFHFAASGPPQTTKNVEPQSRGVGWKIERAIGPGNRAALRQAVGQECKTAIEKLLLVFAPLV